MPWGMARERRPYCDQEVVLGTKFGGLSPSEVRRRRQFEEKSAKPTRLVADFALDKAIVRGFIDLRQGMLFVCDSFLAINARTRPSASAAGARR